MNNTISFILLALLVFIISLLIYFLINWAVREGIKEAYHDIKIKKIKNLQIKLKKVLKKLIKKELLRKSNTFFLWHEFDKIEYLW